MKALGFICMALGLALIIFTIYHALTTPDTLHSPLPQEHGVRVIYITPGKEK